ncbi:glycosyltransferase family 4 protein [Novosphingobium terrae]|uniref:glycosyltransferase family 4 protein n=1 Tax=Novosphingobium terrae TaxID=2726189 RepID=UPI00197F3878|nr:glycosyltransferase family 4 protein [Novosphingobium terrae]
MAPARGIARPLIFGDQRIVRIVHLLKHSRKANGHVEVAVDLACEQARLGHEVLFVAGAGHFAPVLARHGVTFIEVPEGGVMQVMSMLRDLAIVLRRTRPDIVHAHMVSSAMLAWLLKPLGGYRLITTLHNSFDRQSRLMGFGDLVIAVSDAVRREMIEKGIPGPKLRVVHNGTVNGARRAPTPFEAATLERPAIVTVAGLHPRKGIDTLIDAFAALRGRGTQAHLYIVGAGPAREALEEQAAASGHAGDIHFMGYMTDPLSVLAGADVFVLASLAEPCALALIEARQMGCACIASDVGGNPEILDFGKSGRLFTAGNSAQLAEALQAVIGDSAELARLRQAAQDGRAHWTVERMARETVDVYREARGLERRAERVQVPEGALPQ